jgi:hypothetical protein
MSLFVKEWVWAKGPTPLIVIRYSMKKRHRVTGSWQRLLSTWIIARAVSCGVYIFFSKVDHMLETPWSIQHQVLTMLVSCCYSLVLNWTGFSRIAIIYLYFILSLMLRACTIAFTKYLILALGRSLVLTFL